MKAAACLRIAWFARTRRNLAGGHGTSLCRVICPQTGELRIVIEALGGNPDTPLKRVALGGRHAGVAAVPFRAFLMMGAAQREKLPRLMPLFRVKPDLLRSHEELRAALRIAGSEIRRLNFGRADTPVLRLLRRVLRESRAVASPGGAGQKGRSTQA